MAGFRTVVIVAIIALVIAAYSSLFIVDQRQAALVTRFGEIQRVVTEPGLYVKLPVIDELIPIEKRVLNFESTDMAVQVSDGRRYLVEFRHHAPGGRSEALPRDRRRLAAAGLGPHQDPARRGAAADLRPAQFRCRPVEGPGRDDAGDPRPGPPRALALGIEVVDVRIRRTDLMPEVMNDTYERMTPSALAEAAQLRAVGQAEAARIRAEADREAVELVALARRESEIVRGKGDGERNKVFAEAYQKDPEFFSFYRSMAGLCQKPGRCRNDADLEPDLGVLQIFGGKSSAAPSPAPPPASQTKPPATPPAGESGTAPAQPLNQAPAANP